MNIYGLRAQEHWQKADPTRYEALENPEEFFTDLGEQISSRVVEISLALERALPGDLEYLARVGQLTAIKRQAEEVAFEELVTIDYVPTGDEAREFWEGARPSDDALPAWAIRRQEYPDSLDDPEFMAEKWLLPATFFEELEKAENPYEFLKEHDQEVKDSADKRYRIYQETGQL